jgi:hypothetical protein
MGWQLHKSTPRISAIAASIFCTVVPCFDRQVIFHGATNAPAKGAMTSNASP